MVSSTSSFRQRKPNNNNALEKATVEEQERQKEPGIVQGIEYLKMLAKYRRPSSMVPRIAKSALVSSSNTGVNYLSYKPPYDNKSLDRFEDAFRSDKLIQNAIVKRTELILGQHGNIVMDTTEEFDSEDDRTAALQKITGNQKYQDARKKIQKLQIKPSIDFHNNLKAAVIQCKIYGRAATQILGSDNDGLPQSLHVLNSKRLAQPDIDTDTWALRGVRYLDLQKGPSGMDDIISIEDLLYFTNRDFHVSPGSLYYGLSELEGVVDGSDSKRIAKQEDIKEIMKSNWAPFLIMKFNNPNISVAQMQEIVNSLTPGMPFAHKQDITSEKIDLQSNLKQITDGIDFLNTETARDLGVPTFLLGYERVANYANSQQILLAYKEIELKSDRTWIKDIVQQQWLNRFFYQLLGIDIEAGDEPEVKLSYEFEDVSFETKLDKVNADLLLFDRQLISGEKVLRTVGYEDQIEEYKLLQEQKQQQKDLMMQKLQQQQQLGNGSGNGNANQQNQNNNNQQQQNTDAQGRQPPTPIDQNLGPSTTVRKRSGSSSSIDLYEKFIDTLDSIAEGGS